MRKLLLAAVVASMTLATATAQEWTTVKGQFVLPKEVPIPKRVPLKATQDADLAAKDKDFNSEDIVVSAKTRGIKNIVVWLLPEPTEKEVADFKANKIKVFPSFKAGQIDPKQVKPAKPEVELDQPCCRFIPHVLAAQAGQNLLIKNSAPVAHNAKFDSSENGNVNPLIPAGGQYVVKDLKAERLPIVIECSIHRWMKAYLRVFDHPYFAVTDDDGKFEIKNAPVMGGKLRLMLWHEMGVAAKERPGRTIEVKAGTVDLGQLSYTPQMEEKK